MLQPVKNAINFGKSILSSPIHSDQPLIIFESDDWGCIRMPSKATKEKIQAINPDWVSDPYLQYDALETKEDLEALFNLLAQHKDAEGKQPVLTANCIGMNPDFNKIKEGNFSAYFHEAFTETFLQNPGTEQSFQIEKEAFKQGLFVPQFHGREHLHVLRWMEALRSSNELLSVAFKNRMISLRNKSRNNCIGYYMDAMNPVSEANLEEVKQITMHGLEQFRSVWGFESKSMIAPCYLWHKSIESDCQKLGVRIFQGIKYQFASNLSNNPENYSKVFHYAGEKQNGVRYNIRNAFFEPSLNKHKDWASFCLRDIVRAVNRHGFATVSVHRLNFMGSIEPGNRTRNLKMFDELLNGIKKAFPGVKYISTPELLSYWTAESDAEG